MNQPAKDKQPIALLIIDQEQEEIISPTMCVRNDPILIEQDLICITRQKKKPQPAPPPSAKPIQKPTHPPITQPPTRPNITLHRIPSTDSNGSGSHIARQTDFTQNMWKSHKPQERNSLIESVMKFRQEIKLKTSPLQVQIRREAAERLFAGVIYGVEEINKITKPSSDELKIRELSKNAQYLYAKKIAMGIESALFKTFPESNKDPDFSYKGKFAMLFRYMRDDDNPQLRRKIVLLELSPDKLVTSRQEELWSQKKRLQAMNKEMKFMNSINIVKPKIELEEDEVAPTYQFEVGEKVEKKTVKTNQKSVQSIIQSSQEKLRTMLSATPKEWLKQIKQDLPGQYSKILENSIRTTFHLPSKIYEEKKESERHE